jgi:hypothetical protein
MATAKLTTTVTAKQERQKWSAAARKRMRKIQLARWAKIKGHAHAAPARTTAKAPKKKRGVAAARRRALSEAMKKPAAK